MGKKSLLALASTVLLIVGGALYVALFGGLALAGQHEPQQSLSSVPLQIFALSANPAIPGPGVMISPPTGDMVHGSQSTLVRAEDWLAVSIHTHNLPAGAYTFWWVIDEDGNGFMPSNPRSIAINAGGLIVTSSGITDFSAVLPTGDVPEADWLTVLRNGDGAFDTTRTAKVMIVVRYHGPVAADSELVDKQTNTFLGGCTNVGATGQSPSGDYVCFDPQRAVHVP